MVEKANAVCAGWGELSRLREVGKMVVEGVKVTTGQWEIELCRRMLTCRRDIWTCMSVAQARGRFIQFSCIMCISRSMRALELFLGLILLAISPICHVSDLFVVGEDAFVLAS